MQALEATMFELIKTQTDDSCRPEEKINFYISLAHAYFQSNSIKRKFDHRSRDT